MQELNEFELSTAKEIVNIGLSKGADALAFFVREKVLIKSMDFKISALADVTQLTSKSKVSTALITDIMGELKGSCYFVFSEEEVTNLLKVALPADVLNDPEKFKTMSNAILLEVDNIISASVVTQFSNLLKYKMFGGVPQMKKITSAEINEFILSKAPKDACIITFKSEFITSMANFNPEFIWVLEAALIDGIKRFVTDETNLKKIQELKSAPAK